MGEGAHWLLTVSILTLAFTGFVILMAHPRLYWGETGNGLTPALIELPISRNHRHGGWVERTPIEGSPGAISANRTYRIFNQNGWGRSLHFLSAWFVVVPGAIYLIEVWSADTSGGTCGRASAKAPLASCGSSSSTTFV